MNDITINKTILINAAPETVWRYLTDKDKLATWFHGAEEDLKPDQSYALGRKQDDQGQKQPIIWGRVLEWVENEKLVTTFVIAPFGDSETTVHWLLEAVPCGTRLTLMHEGIEAAAGEAAISLLLALDAGWDEHFIGLRKLA